jgi:hypothetical protein
MRPVEIIALPHNYRGALYPTEADGPSFDAEHETGEPRAAIDPPPEWAVLPIPMPEQLTVFTDREGRVIAAWCDDRQIRWRDLDTVVTGIEQYNRDCARDIEGDA